MSQAPPSRQELFGSKMAPSRHASGVDGRKPSQSRRAAIWIQPGIIFSMTFLRDAMSGEPGHM